jgi:tetratricopeptide (TPR) repeat protein
LSLVRDLGDRRGEANTLDSLGFAYHLLGKHGLAIEQFEKCIDIKEELDDRHGLAVLLDHVGDVYRAIGNIVAARDAWERALQVLSELGIVRAGSGPGYPDGRQIGRKLGQLPDSVGPGS